jgi:hypothetical protein
MTDTHPDTSADIPSAIPPTMLNPLTVGQLRQLLAGVPAHLALQVATDQTNDQPGDTTTGGLQPVIGLGLTTTEPHDDLIEDTIVLWCSRHMPHQPS